MKKPPKPSRPRNLSTPTNRWALKIVAMTLLETKKSLQSSKSLPSTSARAFFNSRQPTHTTQERATGFEPATTSLGS